MKVFFIVFYALAIICAVVFLFFPGFAVKASKMIDRVLLDTDEKMYAARKPLAVLFILAAIVLTWGIISIY